MDNVRPLRPKKKSSKPRRDPRTRRRIIIGVVAAVVVLVLAFGSRLLGIYVDWLWFGELGFRDVFWTRIWAQLLLGVVGFVLFFAVIWANVELARRLAPDFRADVDGTLLEPRSPLVRRWVGIGGAVVCVVVAFIAAVSVSGSWQQVLLYLNQTPWGEQDAQFGRDIAFFVFSIPFWQGVLAFVMAALIAALVLAAIVHVIMGGIEIRQKTGGTSAREEAGPSPFARVQQPPQIPQVDIKLAGRAVAHLSVLLATIFVVVGIGQLFKAWDLVYSTAGAIYGAAYTDIVVRLPMARVTMVIAFLLAGALVWNALRRRQWWWAPAAVVVWIVALILLRGVVPAAYQSLVVNPNQLSKEREYISRNLDATKMAYGLNAIEQVPVSPRDVLTPQRLEANQATLRNIRLWDPRTLVTSYRQLQEFRPYYVFLDADVDRYTVNGVYRQTMLSARELNIEGLPAQAQTWVNQHITYTHGFGVAMSAVNQVTADGSPDFLVQDVPPRSAPGLEIEQPRIYFGERGTDYTLVNTTEAEFDYPASEGDVYTDGYTGSGGVPISPVLNRLAFSARYGTIKFFTTSALQGESRLIFRNNIRERVQAAAPFLELDPDPYMVIADGRLWWIQDAYTTTDRYPYSTPQGDLNYLRNSVKIVVDAYNGTMVFYAWDEEDPLLQALQAIYPDFFTPRSEIPEALMDHVRYPETLFDIQAETWTTYHVDGPEILYNKGDQWAIPENVSTTEAGRMDSYYMIMRLPDETDEEFIQMLPFVPNGRKNMISWLAARSDEPQYGSALNILFSRSTTVFGPNQVESAINQDPEISAQRTLWGQQGSEVILGNLLVIPIDDSLLYVQPLYLQSDQTQLPQMKRVIVFYRAPEPEGGDENARQVVAMRPTLGEALIAAFGETFDTGNEQGGTDTGEPDGEPGAGTGGQAGGVSAEARELIARANREFSAAQAALQAGDFAEYGRRIDLLERALTDLQRLQQR